MKFVTIFLLLIGFLFPCYKYKSGNSMIEKYDFELINKSNSNPVGIRRNGWIILMYKMTQTGAFYDEYPPVPHFYKIQKQFYPNGNIKSITELPIGKQILYDESGDVIQNNEFNKYGGEITYDWLLKFIEKEGWINLKTGEGREDAIIHEDGRCEKIIGRFQIGYANELIPYWEIIIIPMKYNQYHKTIYHIDKDNGNLLHKESKIVRLRK